MATLRTDLSQLPYCPDNHGKAGMCGTISPSSMAQTKWGRERASRGIYAPFLTYVSPDSTYGEKFSNSENRYEAEREREAVKELHQQKSLQRQALEIYSLWSSPRREARARKNSQPQR